MPTTVNDIKLKKCNVNDEKCKIITVNGVVEVWRAEIILPDLIAAATESPAFTTGSQTFNSAVAWDLRGWETLTGTLTVTAAVGFWAGHTGVVYSQTAAASLRMADGTTVPLQNGKIAVNLKKYTDEQLASVNLQGTINWSLSEVTNSFFSGDWRITGAIAS